MEKHKLQLTWAALIMIFILCAGWMIGKAGADYDQQKLQISLECIKAGGSPEQAGNGMICKKK
jgi:hypothetical protein